MSLYREGGLLDAVFLSLRGCQTWCGSFGVVRAGFWSVCVAIEDGVLVMHGSGLLTVPRATRALARGSLHSGVWEHVVAACAGSPWPTKKKSWTLVRLGLNRAPTSQELLSITSQQVLVWAVLQSKRKNCRPPVRSNLRRAPAGE